MDDGMRLPHCAKGSAVCQAARLNVRERPHTAAKVPGVLTLEQRVTVWALDEGWMIVQAADGLTGWAAAAYLRVDAALTP